VKLNGGEREVGKRRGTIEKRPIILLTLWQNYKT
jgi:hypothetical protein